MSEEMTLVEYKALLKTQKKKRNSFEHQEQVALFNFLDTMETKYPILFGIHAIPNGGLRDKITAANLKAEGAKAGVLDVFVPVSMMQYSDDFRSYLFHGLYIEMKYGKNTMTDDQRTFADFVIKQGYLVKVCYTWIEAAKEIFDYLDFELPEGVE